MKHPFPRFAPKQTSECPAGVPGVFLRVSRLFVCEASETAKEVDFAETPFVQLADLFAGMVAYTRTKSHVIQTLMAERQRRQELFPDDVPASPASETDWVK